MQVVSVEMQVASVEMQVASDKWHVSAMLHLSSTVFVAESTIGSLIAFQHSKFE